MVANSGCVCIRIRTFLAPIHASPVSSGFLYSALMAHAFLAFSITNAFQITYLGFGPTEVRLFFMGLNTAIIYGQVAILITALPYITAVLALGLCIVVYRGQKQIWALDMAAKESRTIKEME